MTDESEGQWTFEPASDEGRYVVHMPEARGGPRLGLAGMSAGETWPHARWSEPVVVPKPPGWPWGVDEPPRPWGANDP